MEVTIKLRQEDYSEKRIEALFRVLGLEVALKTVLTKYPGGVHWHLKNPMRKGRSKRLCGTMNSFFR